MFNTNYQRGTNTKHQHSEGIDSNILKESRLISITERNDVVTNKAKFLAKHSNYADVRDRH